VKILYLAIAPDLLALPPSGVAEHPDGRSLARQLSTEHEVRVRGAIAPADSPAFKDEAAYSIMSADELEEFDAVYMEGGWDLRGGFDLMDDWDLDGRFPLELAEAYVRRGGQLIVADADESIAVAGRESLNKAADLFGASHKLGRVGRGKNEHDSAFCLDDPDHENFDATRYFASQMQVSGWLEPALEGVDSLLAQYAVELRLRGADIAASGTTNTFVHLGGTEIRGLPGERPAWATVQARGLGHAVLIAAKVSEDNLVDKSDNSKWISNLLVLLAERSRETAGWAEPVQREQKPVSIPDLHVLISDASGAKFVSGHYDDAVSAAFKAVERRVKTLTGSPKSGKPLMTQIFNEQSPTLDIAHDELDEGQRADEAEGFKYLFMGAVQGLRNPRAHGADPQTDEQEAMEMLATASLLMRALDRAEKRMRREG
jgi:uncharacterized protein (TIGR02391 family)